MLLYALYIMRNASKLCIFFKIPGLLSLYLLRLAAVTAVKYTDKQLTGIVLFFMFYCKYMTNLLNFSNNANKLVTSFQSTSHT